VANYEISHMLGVIVGWKALMNGKFLILSHSFLLLSP